MPWLASHLNDEPLPRRAIFVLLDSDDFDDKTNGHSQRTEKARENGKKDRIFCPKA
jgi:hypothetical protein